MIFSFLSLSVITIKSCWINRLLHLRLRLTRPKGFGRPHTEHPASSLSRKFTGLTQGRTDVVRRSYLPTGQRCLVGGYSSRACGKPMPLKDCRGRVSRISGNAGWVADGRRGCCLIRLQLQQNWRPAKSYDGHTNTLSRLDMRRPICFGQRRDASHRTPL